MAKFGILDNLDECLTVNSWKSHNPIKLLGTGLFFKKQSIIDNFKMVNNVTTLSPND